MREAKFTIGALVSQSEYEKIHALKLKGFTIAAILRCGVAALEESLAKKE